MKKSGTRVKVDGKSRWRSLFSEWSKTNNNLFDFVVHVFKQLLVSSQTTNLVKGEGVVLAWGVKDSYIDLGKQGLTHSPFFFCVTY